MSSYDVFINGISPERIVDAEKIKNKASLFFKIEQHQLEILWSSPDGFCIRRGINEQEAKKTEEALSKFGLICRYRPAKVILDTSAKEVKPKSKSKSSDLYTCPNCSHDIPKKDYDSVPEKCPACGIFIAKFLAIKKHEQEQEQEATKHLLETESESALNLRKLLKKQFEEEREELRKRELEATVLMVAKRNARNRIIIAGLLAVPLSVALGYMLFGNDVRLFAENYNTGKKKPHDIGKKTLTSATEYPVKKTDAKTPEKKTEENLPKLTSIVSLSPTSVASTQLETKLTAKITSLLQAGENAQEWDLFLSKAVLKSIESDSLAKALVIARNINDTELYVDTMGKFLAVAVQQTRQVTLSAEIVSAMESRINSLPISEQAGYFAQAGFYQNHATKKSSLFNRADSVFGQLTTPDSKIKSASKMAGYYFKAGNVDVANRYFTQMVSLLNGVQSPAQQVIARIAIAKAYKGVNDTTNADNWLVSTGNFVQQITPDVLEKLVEAYALINQLPTPVMQYVAIDRQSVYLYDAISQAVMSNLIDNAIDINKTISDPVYRVLAFDLIASYDQKNADYYLALADKLARAIKSPVEEAIVASRLARHYARNGASTKAIEFLKIAKEQVEVIPDSELKDNVLGFMAKNCAFVFQFENADKLLAGIQSAAIKTRVKNDIAKLLAISNQLAEPVK